jgi:predicted nucleic acid-binding protein
MTSSTAMAKPRIYIDSSVIGYLANRPSANLLSLGRQIMTQEWWQLANERFELFVSNVVIDECAIGNEEAANRRVGVCSVLNSLAINAAATELSLQLMQQGTAPHTEPEDALHIALATVHGMDCIATWNFSHMASRDAKVKLSDGLTQLGFKPPVMATPEELLEVTL